MLDRDKIDDIMQDLKDDFGAYLTKSRPGFIKDAIFVIDIPISINRSIKWEDIHPYIEELEGRLHEIGYKIVAHRIHYIETFYSNNVNRMMANSSFLDDGKISEMEDFYIVDNILLYFGKEETRFLKFKNFLKLSK